MLTVPFEQVPAHARDERGVTQRIGRYGVEHGEPRRCTERTPVGHRPVHLDDRARRSLREHVVEPRDLAPVGVLGTLGTGVLRGDRGLEEVLADRSPTGSERPGSSQRSQPAPDQLLVPPCAVLRLEQHRHPGVIHASRGTRTLDLQQRLQPQGLGLGGSQRREHPGQPDALVRERRAHPVLPGRGGIPLVEDQVDHGHHVVESFDALGPGLKVELGTRLGKRLLRARDPLAHGRFRDEEAAGDLSRGEATDEAQGERGPRLRGERRVAGQEDQAQDVVLDVVDLGVEVGHLLLLSTGVAELLGLAAQGVGAAEVVDAAALGRRHEPGGRVVRHPARRPLLEGCDEGVLGEVLGELDVARHPGEGSHEPRRLSPPRGGDGLGGRRLDWHVPRLRSACHMHVAPVGPDAAKVAASGHQAGQASAASGGASEICRSVATIEHSGQYFACSSANSCWPATASSRLSYCRIDQPPTTSLDSA